MKELFFIRHGQTEWNAIRRMQGQWNSDLSDLGRAQADRNGRFLRAFGIDYMVASPLDRTRQTAEIVGAHLGLDFDLDHRIKEWDCGDWSGEMWDQVSEKWPDEFAAWQADQFFARGPNTENYPDMIERSTPFLEELLAGAPAKIAIVSHGMIGRAMIGTLLEMSPDDMLSFSQSNETIIHLTQRDGGYVTQHFIDGIAEAGLPPRTY